ncbi:hypothetical protein GGR57DRAFT_517646 [Xylariaceae sp. FL1272]|nr:hypothetical protein GGR57DRAFT_517646 [Xylariaceae sp. FL1272]
MDCITALPCELMLKIFRKLDRIEDLASCLLTCRYFYFSYYENPALAADIIKRRLDLDDLAKYTAISELLYQPSLKLPELSYGEVLKLADKEPSKLVDRLRTYPIWALMQIEAGHKYRGKYDPANPAKRGPKWYRITLPHWTCDVTSVFCAGGFESFHFQPLRGFQPLRKLERRESGIYFRWFPRKHPCRR